MTFIDIHTHNSKAEHAVYNNGTAYNAEKRISIGIHPWYITDGWESQFSAIADSAKAANVVAIGECGVDMLKSPVPIGVQEEIFLAHAQLAETLCKPLIIHCVKAFDRIIALHYKLKPQQAWIIHGFRGKPQLAQQLIRAGFYISLGERFNPDSTKIIPIDRLFIESDESSMSIADIYAAIAATKGIPCNELAQQIMANTTHIFKQF